MHILLVKSLNNSLLSHGEPQWAESLYLANNNHTNEIEHYISTKNIKILNLRILLLICYSNSTLLSNVEF